MIRRRRTISLQRFPNQSHKFRRKSRVKRIGPRRIGGTVTPMFVHPQPRCWILSHIRLGLVPTCLCEFPTSSSNTDVDFWIENDPVTAIRFVVAVDGNNGD